MWVSASARFRSALQLGFGGQVGPGVALLMDGAALAPGAGSCFVSCSEDAFHAVVHKLAGRRGAREQGLVCGHALAVAPLRGGRITFLAVNRGRQAPAVHIVPSSMTVWGEVLAPCATSPEGACIAVQPDPGSQRVVRPRGFPARRWKAVVALYTSHCQHCRSFPPCPFLRIGRSQMMHVLARFNRVLMAQSNGSEPARNAVIHGKTKMTPRHTYRHNSKPAP